MEKRIETLHSEYKQLRQTDINSRASSNTPFSESEQQASRYLIDLVSEIQRNPDINTYTDLHGTKATLEATDLYKLISKMPKGIMQHMHLAAAIPKDFFIQLTYNDNTYYHRQECLLKVGNESLSLDKLGFVNLNALRAEEGSAKIDAEIRSLVTFNIESFRKPILKDILRISPCRLRLYAIYSSTNRIVLRCWTI